VRAMDAVGDALRAELDSLRDATPDELLRGRRTRFRRLGRFVEIDAAA